MKKQYELRRFTRSTGGIGTRIISGSMKDCLRFLYAAISLNKYEFTRSGRFFNIERSPYGRQTKSFMIIESK